MSRYDYLIVGAGLYGSVFAQQAKMKGKSCLVIDRRDHIAGNLYCKNIEGINVHQYGAHIFHTNDKEVWQYVNSFVEFNRYTNSPLAIYKGQLYNMPFNMNTFYKLWNVKTPEEALTKLTEQRAQYADIEPENLEQQALKLVGKDIYDKLIKGYTEKQWGKSTTELPAFIIKRLPLRFTFDNNYFNDIYQGIPIGGYNVMIEKMLDGIEVTLGVDFLTNRNYFETIADKVIYTGMIDAYFNYCLGELEYRSLHFEHELLDVDNYQGNAVVNYTERQVPYTRIIEHKHFEFGQQKKTIITKEYSQNWDKTKEAYYPVNNEQNNKLASEYKKMAKENVIFAGRLGDYAYYDMDKVIRKAIDCASEIV